MPYTAKKYKQKITLGDDGNRLIILIAICLIFFVGLAFMKAIWFFRYNDNKELALALFNKEVLGLFTLPADTGALLQKPWSVFTHFFVHDSVWNVFANMLWLWCFGYILQDITGNKKIVAVFLYGALGGAAAFLLACNFIPSLKENIAAASLSGASAGVMAVAVATTLISPEYRIFPMLRGGIPLWALTVIYIIADLATVSISDTGLLLAHVAGGLTGFLFIWLLRQGYDGSEWVNNFFEWAGNLFNPDKPKRGSKPVKEELFYKESPGISPYKRTPHVTEQRINAILDKIGQAGYDSLTDEEKDLLKRAGQGE